MSYQQYRPSSFQILPPVIKNLLIINAIMLFAQFVLRNTYHMELSELLGLHFFFASGFRPWQLITYMFMHGDIWHLLSNMFALWMFGSTLENYWGAKRFLTFYLITGLGAAFTHYVVVYFQVHPMLEAINAYLNNPDLKTFEAFVQPDHLKIISNAMLSQMNEFAAHYNSLEAQGDKAGMLRASVEFMQNYKADYLNSIPPIVGASGSIFGVLLAFGMLFPNTLLYLYFAIPVKAKYFVIAYGALELYSGLSNNPADNVAHFAHLGGMLFGFILIKYWGHNRTNFY